MSSAPHHNDSTIVKNINGTSGDRYTSNPVPAFEKCNIVIRFKIDGLHKKFIAAGGTDSAMCQVKGCSNPGAATAHVIKEMATQPVRRIGALKVTITIPAEKAAKLTGDDRKKLQEGALHCPVHKSLHPDIAAPIEFIFGN